MAYVVISILSFVIGAILMFALCGMAVTRWMVGSIKIVYVNDRIERMHLEINDDESKKQLKDLKYVLLNLKKVQLEDLDDLTQNIQGV